MFIAQFALAIATLALVSGCSTVERADLTTNVAGRSFLTEKGRTMAPFPHVVFCMETPGQCRNHGGRNVIAMTSKTQDLLATVNNVVNNSIAPRESPGQPWQIDPSAGDCNDYAVSKRSRLIQAGLPTRAVRLAITKTPQGIGHTVVVVRTSGGDVVLDNRTSAIRRWDRTDLSWVKVESTNNPRNWDLL